MDLLMRYEEAETYITCWSHLVSEHNANHHHHLLPISVETKAMNHAYTTMLNKHVIDRKY